MFLGAVFFLFFFGGGVKTGRWGFRGSAVDPILLYFIGILEAWNFCSCRFVDIFSRWWFQIFFHFHPYLGKWSNLTNMFQMGWNHQPVLLCKVFFFPTRWFKEKLHLTAEKNPPPGSLRHWVLLMASEVCRKRGNLESLAEKLNEVKVDGRNQANHPGCIKPLYINNGIFSISTTSWYGEYPIYIRFS